MANQCPISSQFVVFIIITYFMFILGELIRPLPRPLPNDILSLHIATRLRTDPNSIKLASSDYGNLVQENSIAVLYPSSIDDIVTLIKFANNCSTPLISISARGHGHSVRGQAMARDGVVVDMGALSENGIGIRVSSNRNPSSGYYYADVVSWTDYLYLTVGGTLSNAGISGQSFLHGPQISNVLELDVVTGKGDFITCSKNMNSELFLAVLGGLGQFGIITRARIILQKAPTRAKWVRLLYSDFSIFTRDQEHLISTNIPSYVEGSLITHMSPPNNWRSSFYSPSHYSKITSLLKSNNGHLYSIEVVKYYDDQSADTIDEELQSLLKDLGFNPGFIFKKDVALIDFLGRVGNIDNQNSEGQLETHPWLNLFVPKSRILDFNAGVFLDIIARHNQTSGPILFYPFNRNKWDDRMSAVIPDEDIFYTLGLLHSSRPDQSGNFDKLNNEIIEFCEKAGIKIKQYLPHYKSKKDWMKHYGPKWNTFQETKTKYDPKMILSPGQRIFNSVDSSDI
ncbi:hypothetical protein DH2020_045899 [Rehmannia glutinosa]|uniref:cytokinin dehydrogenase n=1 Tax=Rehmannia glutinosa TaxID=99300 RepID=A0ABR0UDH3_REHGL